MKKIILGLMAAAMALLMLAGCSDAGESAGEVPAPSAQEDASEAASIGPDVDLTALSSTMVYAEVYRIMTDPEQYAGKTIKLRGQYTASFFEDTRQYYHFVLIADAAACCQQGLEFFWSGAHSYPEDYPREAAFIELMGVFDSYEELGNIYYRITTDDVKVI